MEEQLGQWRQEKACLIGIKESFSREVPLRFRRRPCFKSALPFLEFILKGLIFLRISGLRALSSLDLILDGLQGGTVEGWSGSC
jgi:hypothetical protein